MLLTRKSSGVPVARAHLSRTLVLAKTIDRRTFLKRSGVAVGAGAALSSLASQLPFSMIDKAEAATEAVRQTARDSAKRRDELEAKIESYRKMQERRRQRLERSLCRGACRRSRHLLGLANR